MGLFDFLKKKSGTPKDIIKDVTLKTMKPGYFVDYDMKTWEVTGCHYYDWGNGDITHEWQLKSHDETLYLEHEEDDEDIFSISKKLSMSRLDKHILDHILEHDDPPEQIRFEGTDYFLEETSGGRYFKDATASPREMIKWDYSDESGKEYLTIEQWGETDFEASLGKPAETYQFTNILPGSF